MFFFAPFSFSMYFTQRRHMVNAAYGGTLRKHSHQELNTCSDAVPQNWGVAVNSSQIWKYYTSRSWSLKIQSLYFLFAPLISVLCYAFPRLSVMYETVHHWWWLVHIIGFLLLVGATTIKQWIDLTKLFPVVIRNSSKLAGNFLVPSGFCYDIFFWTSRCALGIIFTPFHNIWLGEWGLGEINMSIV